ncbi:hypothetical protein EVAR_56010_1 [Eumeta japonica]|uniref:Uncharacterized protein n=1 Tax=Eumeta variegata TaxID=151549 RepID=A0A4C1YUF7_EUMVA|nr:hypothetical protein EVAR_56010_1 [Eumeta japonica]
MGRVPVIGDVHARGHRPLLVAVSPCRPPSPAHDNTSKQTEYSIRITYESGTLIDNERRRAAGGGAGGAGIGQVVLCHRARTGNLYFYESIVLEPARGFRRPAGPGLAQPQVAVELSNHKSDQQRQYFTAAINFERAPDN